VKRLKPNSSPGLHYVSLKKTRSEKGRTFEEQNPNEGIVELQEWQLF
jgi:hypothetical protein